MKGWPAFPSSAIAAEVFAICIRDSSPSCMRAPPDAAKQMKGHSWSIE